MGKRAIVYTADVNGYIYRFPERPKKGQEVSHNGNWFCVTDVDPGGKVELLPLKKEEPAMQLQLYTVFE